MADYRDNYYGSILDPLHGDIKLSEIEKWIIAEPLFYRLRRIKQNTFLYYVFPSANHTRFEHSIGVMHTAGKIFDSCKENYATGEKKRTKYAVSQKSSFFDLNNLKEKEEIYYQELRIAALLHDIGHGPMSHLFDDFSIDKDSFLNIVTSEECLLNYEKGFDKLVTDHKKVEHESISCAFVFYLIDKLKKACYADPYKFSISAATIINAISAERIVKIIEPTFLELKDLLDNDGNSYTHFFSRIVSAFPIDADRMDYFLRDSYFSGVTYGIYDTNRIFSSFQAMKKGADVHLSFRQSGLDSMLRFIQCRTHLFNQVYFHKTNRAANTMLTYSTSTFKDDNKKLLNIKSLDKLITFYLENSDEKFVSETVKSEMCINDYEKSVLDDLIRRKLFKRVYENKIVLRGKQKELLPKIKDIQKQINSKLKSLIDEKIYAVADQYANETFKDFDKKPIIIATKNSSSIGYSSSEDWKSAGKEFELSDMTVSMVRIYIARTFHSPDEYTRIKKIVLEKVSEERLLLEKLSEEQT